MNYSNSNHSGDPCPKCGWQSKPVSWDDRMLGRHNSGRTCEELVAKIKEYLRVIGFSK